MIGRTTTAAAPASRDDDVSAGSPVDAWRRSGAAALTGRSDGPALNVVTPAAHLLDELLAPLGADATVLSERARLMGLTRNGSTSCGGAARIMRAADGWFVMSLARRSDIELLPAWCAIAGLAPLPDTAVASARLIPPGEAMWRRMESSVASARVAQVVAAGVGLGLACCAVGELTERAAPSADAPWPSPLDGPPDLGECRVLDLTALWAGPLCAALLRRCGAITTKVEDVGRPDGGRAHPSFFEHLNSGTTEMQVDLSKSDGVVELRRLCSASDIVISSSRRRAFDAFGIDPVELTGGGSRTRLWVAITGYGWDVDRVGFGDDTAAAAGLVAATDDISTPCFAGDAIADPMTGSVAAVRAATAWRDGESGLIDCSLAATAAAVRPLEPARSPNESP